MNTAEELEFVKKIAAATGIVLDPVYRCDSFQLFLIEITGNVFYVSLF